ncbi:MAG: InlB B-repeat-containing protein [Bacilli bacterium]
MKKLFTFLLILFILSGCSASTDKKFTIDFDTLGGPSVPTQEVVEGKTLLIPDDPEWEGYTFEWWYLDIEYTTTLDLPFIPTQSTTLYAKWIPNEYQIAFVTNGGAALSPLTGFHGSPIALPTPERDNYTFSGWYCDSDLTVAFTSETIITGPLVLYADWDEVVLPLLELEEYEVSYLVASMGEDTSRMNINYQVKNIKTYVEVALSEDFQDAIRVNPTMTYFESLSEDMEKPFIGRNICRVELTSLQPGMTYYYRVNQGNDTYSEVYSFHTEGLEDTTDFIFLTDVHYYDGFDGAEVAENVIAEALLYNPNIDFVLNTGDMVDTGGNADDWDRYFTHSDSFKILPTVGIPGNHEHYFVGSMGNRIYSSYFNYPDNGTDAFCGTSYYFIHNDTLFIQIDTDSPYEQGKQLEWMGHVIEANPTKFIIVGTHAPVNILESADYNRAFMEVMEKYAVDIVLAGHYHTQNYSKTYMDAMPVNSQIGVVYFRGAGGGIKGIPTGMDPNDFAKGYIISIGSDEIVIQTIDGNGTLGDRYTTQNYKLAEQQPVTQEEIMDSIGCEADVENETIRFYWSEKAFKNVKSITIEQTYREQYTHVSLVPTPGYVETIFTNFYSTLDNHYTVTVCFNNNEEQVRSFEMRVSGGMGLEAETTQTTATVSFNAPTGVNVTNIKRYEVYNNTGVLLGTYNAKDDLFQVITSIVVEDLQPNSEIELIIHAIGREGFMYQDTMTVTTKP